MFKFYGNALLPLSTTVAYKYSPLTAEIFAKLFSCLPLCDYLHNPREPASHHGTIDHIQRTKIQQVQLITVLKYYIWRQI